MSLLLSREQFREEVFKRDSYSCVFCKKEAKDAHHILERRLFPDGGYYLSNGASLCEEHHILAEQTLLTVEDIRTAANISKKDIILPPHFYSDVVYDKWGNVILNNNIRCPGELFYDESVQKILKSSGQLSNFCKYVKYPRSYHLPWSGYIGKDDRILSSVPFFNNEIVVTMKMDGENTTMYNDHVHARSLDSNSHWTQSWIKQLHSTIKHDIPNGYRICGENLYAKHSIKYSNLDSYFLVFSIWNEKNKCLSWNDTVEYCELLNLKTVPVIFKGTWKDKPEKFHKTYWEKVFDESKNEGYVVRNAGSFSYRDFSKNLGKYVRKNHVTSSSHWKYDKIEINDLNNE